MKFTQRLLGALLLATLMVVGIGAQDAAAPAPRLLLADSTGVVHVFDTLAGEVVNAFDMDEELTEAPRLYVGPSGQYVFAVLRASNVVRVIDSGYVGGEWAEPALLDFTLQTMMPTHFDIYGDDVVSFNDGDGSVTVFSEAVFNGGGTATTFFTGQAHHGVAVMLADVLIATNPTSDSALPIGPAVFNLDGELIAAFDNCVGLHGKAILSDGRVVFGCDDGVSIISGSGNTWEATKITEDAEERMGNFVYQSETGVLLANWGPTSYALVDVDAGTIEEITVSAPLWMGLPTFNPLNPDQVVVLTQDGSLHTVIALTGEVVATAAEVITAYEEPEDEEATVPVPALKVAGGYAYLSDPIAGTLHIISLSDMSEVAVVELGVHVTSIAALGQ